MRFIKNFNNPFLICHPEDVHVAEMERLFKNYVANGHTVYPDQVDSHKAGFLGQVIYWQYIEGNGQWMDSNLRSPYSFVEGDERTSVHCKLRTSEPAPKHEASFFAYQDTGYFTSQVTRYVFMSTTKSWSTVYLCGWTWRADWHNLPTYRVWQIGDIDPSNGMQFKAKTESALYQDLYPMQEKMETKDVVYGS